MGIFFALIPPFDICMFYIVLAAFIIWILIKFIKIQQEQTEILRSILEKLNVKLD
ncbi:hypothetical protein [Lysinibacillus sp. NPDC056232]|uniref:hypothetical protein n=1 Tax=Lysinibacillus sp. NPDC056232 TaxID=3345756 RepID=UPI0035DE154C